MLELLKRSNTGSGFDDESRSRQEPDVPVPGTGNQEEQLAARATTPTVRKHFLHKNTSAGTVSLFIGWHVVSTIQISVIILNYRQTSWRKKHTGHLRSWEVNKVKWKQSM